MKRELGIENVSHDASSVVTVGTYDGVHTGHQAILSYVQKRAVEQQATSTVITFDPHPRAVVRKENVPLLTTPGERAQLLESFGIERFILVDFDQDFARLSPRDYVENFLVNTVGLQEIVIGYDHRFGRDRAGDRTLLEDMGEQFGFDVDVLPAQTSNASQVVSSTEIRTLLREQGNVQEAARLLGRPYSLEGTVIKGAQRGRKIGFPTANIDVPDQRKVIPLNGVYAVKAFVKEDEWKPAMMNIGTRPTFGPDTVHLEAHLLDFEGDLYGAPLRVEFLRRLRDEQQFDGAQQLRKQLSKDRDRCKRVFQALA